MVKILILAIFFIFVLERINVTFSGHNEAQGGKIIAKGITYYLIIMYSLIILLSFIEFLIKNQKIDILTSIAGIVLLLTGRLLRNSAMLALKKSNCWSIYTKIPKDQKLIKSGIYAYLNHPYYLGTILELSGVIFLFNSYLNSLLIVLLFIPALVFRAVIEERLLQNSNNS